MSLGLQAALALFPIALGGVLLIGFRVQAKHAMPAAYAAAVLVAILAWGMAGSRIIAASIEGLFVTFDLLLIHAAHHNGIQFDGCKPYRFCLFQSAHRLHNANWISLEIKIVARKR